MIPCFVASSVSIWTLASQNCSHHFTCAKIPIPYFTPYYSSQIFIKSSNYSFVPFGGLNEISFLFFVLAGQAGPEFKTGYERIIRMILWRSDYFNLIEIVCTSWCMQMQRTKNKLKIPLFYLVKLDRRHF